MKGTRRSVAALASAAVLAVLAATASVNLSGSSLAAPRRAQLDAAKERLMELERNFELVVERYNVVRDRLDKIRVRIAADELVVADISDRMIDKEKVAAATAVELYKGGAAGALEVVLTSDSLADVDARLQYLRSTESAQSKVFERLEADRMLLQDRIERLDRERARALAAKERLGELRSEIQAKIANQRDEITRLNELIRRAERRRELARERAAAAAAAEAAAQASADSTPSQTPIAPIADAGSAAGVAVQAALAQVGDPYQWGGAGPDSFDCSGLTMYAWAQAGVSLPHSSAGQYAATPRVAQSDLQPGDLLFYGSPIHHVAMYIGGGQIVEAPYTGASVRVASAMRSDYVGAGRPGV